MELRLLNAEPFSREQDIVKEWCQLEELTLKTQPLKNSNKLVKQPFSDQNRKPAAAQSPDYSSPPIPTEHNYSILPFPKEIGTIDLERNTVSGITNCHPNEFEQLEGVMSKQVQILKRKRLSQKILNYKEALEWAGKVRERIDWFKRPITFNQTIMHQMNIESVNWYVLILDLTFSYIILDQHQLNIYLRGRTSTLCEEVWCYPTAGIQNQKKTNWEMNQSPPVMSTAAIDYPTCMRRILGTPIDYFLFLVEGKIFDARTNHTTLVKIILSLRLQNMLEKIGILVFTPDVINF
jgi:hypothetical protein